MPGKYLQLCRDSFLSNSFTFIECFRDTEGLCDLTTALLVTSGSCVLCAAVMYKMRPFHYCNAASDLFLRNTKQNDMNLEVNYFVHLVFTTQKRGKMFTSICDRTQFSRYSCHVHATSVLQTYIRGDA